MHRTKSKLRVGPLQEVRDVDEAVYDSDEEEETATALQFAAYVPLQVINHFRLTRAPLLAPHTELIPAAILFADISGFTPLAERLSKMPSGVTTLTQVINSLFDPVIAIVSEYGGDIIKFAGDALLVMFPATSGAVGEQSSRTQVAAAVAVAAECALQLLALIESLSDPAAFSSVSANQSGSARYAAGSPGPLTPIAEPSPRSGSRQRWKRAFQWVKKNENIQARVLSKHLIRNHGRSLYELYLQMRAQRQTEAPAGTLTPKRRTTRAGNSLAHYNSYGNLLATGAVNPATVLAQAIGPENRLRMKLGIGAGTVMGMHVGGVDGRWEFFISGDPITQMAEAEGCAIPGDVIMHAKAYSLLQEFEFANMVSVQRMPNSPHVKVATIRTPCLATADIAVPPDSPMLSAAVRTYLTNLRNLRLEQLTDLAHHPELASYFRGYMPRAVVDRIECAQVEWIGELRKLTILFMVFPDLSEAGPVKVHATREESKESGEFPLGSPSSCVGTPPQISALDAQVYVSTVLDVLSRYEGTLRQFIVDDKGSVLIAALGLPPMAHEDDERRGVHAALEIRRNLSAQNLRCSIGVTTGNVFCGNVGSKSRREYAMVGDAVNLSARLMAYASKAVLAANEHQGENEFQVYEEFLSPSNANPLPDLDANGGPAVMDEDDDSDLDSAQEDELEANRLALEREKRAQGVIVRNGMKLQSGPIICDSNTFELARKFLVFDPLEPFMVKGKTEPVLTYMPMDGFIAVDGPTGDPARSLIGRDIEINCITGELAALVDAVERGNETFDGVGTVAMRILNRSGGFSAPSQNSVEMGSQGSGGARTCPVSRSARVSLASTVATTQLILPSLGKGSNNASSPNASRGGSGSAAASTATLRTASTHMLPAGLLTSPSRSMAGSFRAMPAPMTTLPGTVEVAEMGSSRSVGGMRAPSQRNVESKASGTDSPSLVHNKLSASMIPIRVKKLVAKQTTDIMDLSPIADGFPMADHEFSESEFGSRGTLMIPAPMQLGVRATRLMATLGSTGNLFSPGSMRMSHRQLAVTLQQSAHPSTRNLLPGFAPSSSVMSSARLTQSADSQNNSGAAQFVAQNVMQETTRHSVVFIAGLPSMGTASLLRVAAQAAASHGPNILVGRGACDSWQATPYSCWRQVLASLFPDWATQSPNARHNLLEWCSSSGIDEYLVERLPLLNDMRLWTPPLPETPVTSVMSQTVRSDNLRQLVVKFVERLVCGKHGRCLGVVICLKDAHNFDRLSWDLFAALAKVPNVLLFASIKVKEDAQLHAVYDDLQVDPRTLVINVNALSKDHVRQLMCRELGVESIDSVIVELVANRSVGAPVYIVQLCQLMLSAGFVQIVHGHCQLHPEKGIGLATSLPSSMQGYVHARVDHLDPHDQLLLKVASVVGRVVSVQLLMDVHPDNMPSGMVMPNGVFNLDREHVMASLMRMTEERLLQPLPLSAVVQADDALVQVTTRRERGLAEGRDRFREWLSAAGIAQLPLMDASDLLSASGRRAGGSAAEKVPLHQLTTDTAFFSFCSSAIRDLIYFTMPFTLQQKFHTSIALWFEQYIEVDLGDVLVPVVAYHWARSTNSAKAAFYLQWAARLALASSAYDQAMTCMKMLVNGIVNPVFVRIELPPSEQAKWHRKIAQLMLDTAEPVRRAEMHCMQALQLLECELPALTSMKAITFMLRHRVMNTCYRARPHPTDPTQPDAPMPPREYTMVQTAYALHVLASVASALGNVGLEAFCLLQALALANKSRQARCLARSLVRCGRSWRSIGITRQKATSCCRQALDLIRTMAPDLGLEVQTLTALANLTVQQGQLPLATVLLRQAAETAATAGDMAAWEQIALQHSWVMLMRANIQDAFELYNSCSFSAHDRSDMAAYAIACLGKATCHLERRNLEVASAMLTEAQTVGQLRDPCSLLWFEGLAAYIATLVERQKDAAAHLHNAFALLSSTPQPHSLPDSAGPFYCALAASDVLNRMSIGPIAELSGSSVGPTPVMHPRNAASVAPSTLSDANALRDSNPTRAAAFTNLRGSARGIAMNADMTELVGVIELSERMLTSLQAVYPSVECMIEIIRLRSRQVSVSHRSVPAVDTNDWVRVADMCQNAGFTVFRRYAQPPLNRSLRGIRTQPAA